MILNHEYIFYVSFSLCATHEDCKFKFLINKFLSKRLIDSFHIDNIHLSFCSFIHVCLTFFVALKLICVVYSSLDFVMD